MNDRIEKTVELKAPMERVWRALTDFTEFGQWFRVKLEGPFKLGEATRGNIVYPGYEHLVMEVTVAAIEPMRRFAYYWRPHAVDPAVDYSTETPTLVEFRLEPTPSGGTRLTLIESGFDHVPAHRREEAFRMNDGGWTLQLQNIQAHVDG